MAWSYTKKAEDQLYADDEHGPIIFDPGASLGVPGSGNVISIGVPILGQLAQWTDPTHIAGITVLPTSAIPALTGDVTVVAGTNVTTYANPIPASKAGLPTGGATGQVLVKNSASNFDTGWATGGGDVVAVPTPTVGQLAIWTDAHHVQGVAALPAANFPPIIGDIVIVAGTFISTYNSAVPPNKGGLPLGGSTGQVLQKNTGSNFDTSWANPTPTGGNVSTSGSPQGGQVALWVDGTHVTGANALPTGNLPTVPPAKAGVPPGGLLNQILAKSSNADFDTGWVAPPSGGTGGDLNFVHSQVSPAASWAIAHNLGKFPSVSVVDSGQSLIIPDVHYVDNNNVTLLFGASTSGKAYLN